MKIAGRKNDGAWYRANKFIRAVNNGVYRQLTVSAVQQVIGDIETLPAFVAAMAALAEKTGIPVPTGLQDVASVAAAYSVEGIPREIWLGRLSYDTYTREGAPGEYVYRADSTQAVREFAVDLRQAITRMQFGARAISDVENITPDHSVNPGGRADATVN